MAGFDTRVERTKKILRVMEAEALQICLGIAFIEASDQHRFMANLDPGAVAISELARDGVLLRLAMAMARLTDHPKLDRDTLAGLCSLLGNPDIRAIVAIDGDPQRLQTALCQWRDLRRDERLLPLRTSRDVRFAHSISPNWTSLPPFLTHELTVDLAKDILRLIDNFLIGCNGYSGLDNHSRFSKESSDSYFAIFRDHAEGIRPA